MPELPEVETVRRSLLPHLVGARIREVEVFERRLRRPLQPDFEERLRGRSIVGLERRAKYLLVELDSEDRVLVHLGMSGSLELRAPEAAREPHDHVRFAVETGRNLVFNDPRRFGLLRVGPLRELAELERIGPDPLAGEVSPDELRRAVRGRKLPVKNLLMDQRVLGGIGNIYANEILFRAGVRPQRRAGRLQRREIEALAESIREVLEEAVRQGGSSISDFRDGNGRPGYFQLQLAVYDREGEPCPRCGSPIRRIVLGGRSSFYCLRCQR